MRRIQEIQVAIHDRDAFQWFDDVFSDVCSIESTGYSLRSYGFVRFRVCGVLSPKIDFRGLMVAILACDND